jgi:regulator of protease activity HflC (stomatin/prohibitin superfamily)
MATIILAGLAFAALLVVSRVAAARRAEPGQQRAMSILSKGAMVGAVVVPLVLLLFSTFRVVPAGHVGVEVLFGDVHPAPLQEGLRIVNPLVDVQMMSTQILKHEAQYDAASKDLQAVHITMVLNYRLKPEKAAETYKSIGVRYADIVIVSAAQEVLKANTALHIASEILQTRPKIKEDVQGQLKAWLDKYGIELKEVALSNISFDSGYTHAIEQKQIQEQLAEQKKYELIKATREAEISVATSKGQAEGLREQARGKADALRTEAEAQEAYNRKVASSVTPALIQMEYIKRWDGKLPQYVLGGSGVIFQIPQIDK